MSFHKTTKWRQKRENILRRDKYECQECNRFGKTLEAKTVHHIIPVEQRPDLGLVSKNLISLCTKCHERMHNRYTNELTVDGMRLVERTWGIPPTCN